MMIKNIITYIYSMTPLHRSLPFCGNGACITQWIYEPCHVGPPKMDGSWWTVLTKCDPLEKEMAYHPSIFAMRTSWTVLKDKKIWPWKMSPPGQKLSNMLLGKSRGELLIASEEWRGWTESKMMLSCGCFWWWKLNKILQRTVMHRNLEC